MAIAFGRELKLLKEVIFGDLVGFGNIGDSHPTPNEFDIGYALLQAGLLDTYIGSNSPHAKKADEQKADHHQANDYYLPFAGVRRRGLLGLRQRFHCLKLNPYSLL
jgi:hypothetical protein